MVLKKKPRWAIAVSANADTRRMISSILHDCGFFVLEFDSGSAAFDAMSLRGIAVVVTTPDVSDLPLGGLLLCSLARSADHVKKPIETILVGQYSSQALVAAINHLLNEIAFWPVCCVETPQQEQALVAHVAGATMATVSAKPSFGELHGALKQLALVQ